MAEETKTGRPKTYTEEEKRDIVQKLEPYLKGGLAVSKALLEANIPKSSFYDMMAQDENFRDKINQFRNFTAILLNNALIGELQTIIKKQSGYTDEQGKKVKPQKLTKEDKDFLWKFALNSNLTKSEFGERKDLNLFDPEAEIQKVKALLEEGTTKEITDVEVPND